MNAQTTNEQGSEWSDDDIVDVLKKRAHHLKLANGWSVITLIAAAELMRLVRDDLTQRLRQVEAERDEWKRQYESINMWADERTRERDELAEWKRVATKDLTMCLDANKNQQGVIKTQRERIDKLAQENATLRRQVKEAREWEVVDYLPRTPCACGGCSNSYGAMSETMITVQNGEMKASIVLPDDIRLMRRKQQEADND